jgi:hypothetical protein
MLIIDTLVFVSMMATRIEGIGRRTNTRSTTTFVPLCTYAETIRPFDVKRHLPIVIARGVSIGITPLEAHQNIPEKNTQRLTIQEQMMTA